MTTQKTKHSRLLDGGGESALLGMRRLPCEPMLGDVEIRPALRTRLSSALDIDEDTAIIEELGLCRGLVRIDLAVVNGTIHGYEIKSERDSLRRLAGQVAIYSRVLDQATLVVGTRHIAEALKIVPVWWGILRFETAIGNLRFKRVRRGSRNPGRDVRSLVELLWLDDAIALLERHNAVRGVMGKPRRVVWDRLCETVAVDEIAAAVRARLKARINPPIPVPLS
jgi:hypothetical protein